VINRLYPGKPDYRGPKKGYFTLLHHGGPLLEWSDDVMERIAYIIAGKPERERAIRLQHIVFFPKKLWGKKLQKAYAEWQKAYAEWRKAAAEWQKAAAEWQKAAAERQKAYADKILAYLKKHVKDCRWNGTELVFNVAA
jgi:hypothetical protein